MISKDNYAVTLGDRGRLVLPASLRRQLSLRTGDRLIFAVEEDGSVRLITAREQARALRGLFQALAPGRSLADELIAERREEDRREDE